MSKTNKTSSMFKLALPVCLLSAGALSPVFFPPAGASADSAGAEVNTTVGEFIRLAVDTNELILRDSNNNANITPSASGTLITGDLNVAVSTNTTQGFSISVYTQDNTTSMTHESPSIAATIDSVAGATGYDASTGISDLANNTWGFRKQTGESGGNPTYTNWFGVGADETHGTIIENSNSSSSEYCATLAYPLNSSGCASGTYAEHTLNFGAKLIPSLPGGTYANNVVISAVAKSEGQRYTVDFDSNGGNNTMGPRTIIAGSTFTLPSTSNVIKEGYGIAGYAFTSDAVSATYTPGQTVTVSDFLAAATSAGQTPDSGMTLYLIWQEPVAYMQTFDPSSLADGESTTLVDARDGSVYTVKKFGSGNDTEVWMTQNLVLGYDKGYTLTSADTNIPADDTTTYYLPPAGKRGSVTSSSTVTATNAAAFDSSTAVSEAQVQYRAAGQSGDQSSTGTLFQNTGYYNYPAATLGYSYYNDGLSSGNSPRDICPAGWQLPRGSSTSTYSFYWLDTTLGGTGSNTTTRDKFLNDASFGYSGSYYSSQLYNVGSYGYWWSSTLYSSTGAYLMYLNSDGYVNPQNNSYKYNGFSIRCIAKS